MRGSGDKDNTAIRGAGTTTRVFAVMHDFYTITVGRFFLVWNAGSFLLTGLSTGALL